jgi:hypothetical protein
MGEVRESELMLLPEPTRVTRLGAIVRVPERLTLEGSSSGGLLSPKVASAMLGEPVEAAGGLPAAIRVRLDSALDDPRASRAEQRYALRIAPADVPGSAPVQISAPSITGARHALSTLRQLMRRFDRRLPAMMIEDEPAFVVRGVMLDVSRCRVPTMATLLSTLEMLAGLKVNHVQLYTEHTFAYRGHEAAWIGASPITPAEIKRLDAQARSLGIELAANQNCFGHLHRWLNLPAYQHLAETTGQWMFDLWPRSGPFSLCPTDPASAAFVAGLLDQLAPVFSSPLINIGCDETYDIAYGRSAEAVRQRGRATVYLEFVKSIVRMCRERRKRPMFWADIVLHEPSIIKDVPEDLLGLCWGYEADAPFAQWLETFAAARRTAWVCPGTSSWRTFFGRSSERTGNIASAIEAAQKHDETTVGGVLTCDWGDEGHRQQWPISAVGIAHGASASWNTQHARRLPLGAVSLHALNDPTLQAAEFIERVSMADAPIRAIGAGFSVAGKTGPLRNASALFCDLHYGLAEVREIGTLSQWRAVADTLAAERVPGGLRPRLADQLGHALEVSRLAAARALARRYRGGVSRAARDVLCEQLRGVIGEHRRLWLIDSRSGGLEESAGKYEAVLKRMESEA